MGRERTNLTGNKPQAANTLLPESDSGSLRIKCPTRRVGHPNAAEKIGAVRSPAIMPAKVPAEGQELGPERIEHQGAKSRNSKAQEAHITLCSAGTSG